MRILKSLKKNQNIEIEMPSGMFRKEKYDVEIISKLIDSSKVEKNKRCIMLDGDKINVSKDKYLLL